MNKINSILKIYLANFSTGLNIKIKEDNVTKIKGMIINKF